MIGETFDAPDGDPAKRGTIAAEVPLGPPASPAPRPSPLVIAQPWEVPLYADDAERRQAREALMDYRRN